VRFPFHRLVSRLAGKIRSRAPGTDFSITGAIQLWFNERLEARFSSLTVIDSGGKRVDRGDVAVDTEEPKRISVGVKPLLPGQYKIRFRVLSVDGHIVEDEFPFTIREPQRSP